MGKPIWGASAAPGTSASAAFAAQCRAWRPSGTRMAAGQGPCWSLWAAEPARGARGASWALPAGEQAQPEQSQVR